MHQVLWGISYPNLCMLLATIPVFDPEEKKEGKGAKKVEGLGELAQMKDLMEIFK